MSVTGWGGPSDALGPSASGVCLRLKAAGVSDVVTVPDFVQFSVHERLQSGADGIRQIFTCTEDQAITTAAGLYLGGRHPILMVQNQGLHKGLNSLRAICIDARIPLVFLVGQFGREQENMGHSTRESKRNVVRLTEPILDACNVPYWALDDDNQLASLDHALAHTNKAGGAAAVLVGRYTTWA
ncbi:thiamine pyrophosphate-binding protein [Polaromonas sp. C04]|uniref:thiamine pyrophosphate-binding protein n=1 Tax=Polaromonas sp. C04 TaxID=1945857 RepID=UPI0009848C92|nr:thiamine pyrophosphate-binding protein [Polaromonas sp. C04]OOG51208.1 hypothetical protein B0E49_16475 [Polaromonas sp. C04]